MKKLMGIAAAAGFAISGSANVALADTGSFDIDGEVPQVCNLSMPTGPYDLSIGNNTGAGNEGGFYVTIDCNLPFEVTMAGSGQLEGPNACGGGTTTFPYEATFIPSATMGGGNLVVNTGNQSASDSYSATFLTTAGQAQLDVDVTGDSNQCAGSYTDQITITMTPAASS